MFSNLVKSSGKKDAGEGKRCKKTNKADHLLLDLTFNLRYLLSEPLQSRLHLQHAVVHLRDPFGEGFRISWVDELDSL